MFCTFHAQVIVKLSLLHWITARPCTIPSSESIPRNCHEKRVPEPLFRRVWICCVAWRYLAGHPWRNGDPSTRRQLIRFPRTTPFITMRSSKFNCSLLPWSSTTNVTTYTARISGFCWPKACLHAIGICHKKQCTPFGAPQHSPRNSDCDKTRQYADGFDEKRMNRVILPENHAQVAFVFLPR